MKKIMSYTRAGYILASFCSIKGFTLLEILVAVLIIGILAAIAVPQYQRALLKSRYAALMPIAKSMANSNEAYYLEHGIYADDPQDLLIQGQSRYTDDTELEFGTVSDYAYVLAKNEDKIPNNTFVVYQKHSGEFPGEIHCEALANNDLAESVCKSFGGNESIGKTLTDGYETYVLFGTGNGVAPSGDEGGNDEPETPTCEGVSCDDDGNITECASGQTLNNGECVTCDIENAATCSTTSYAAASCNEGYVLNAGACEPDPAYAQLQARAASLCPADGTQYVCTIKNGAVYRCDTTYGTIDSATGECVSNGTNTGYYEYIYDVDGNEIGYYQCASVDSGHCYEVNHKISTSDGNYKVVFRQCSNKKEITKEGICSNGYISGKDSTYDSHSRQTSEFSCSATTISTTTGECKYYRMHTYDNRYSANGNRSYIEKDCTTVSISNPESTCGNYRPSYSLQYNEMGTAYKRVSCYSSSMGAISLNQNGTCPSGTTLKSYDSATGQYTSCSSLASVNWETATCS